MIYHCRKCYAPQEVPHRYFACRYCGDRDGRGLSLAKTGPVTSLLKPRVVRKKATKRQLALLRGARGEGRPLAIWLARRGSTKLGFAREMGVTRQTVDNWLKHGRSWPTYAHAVYDKMVAEGIRPALLHREVKERWRVDHAAETNSLS